MKHTIIKGISTFIGILCFWAIMIIAFLSNTEGKHILIAAIPVAIAMGISIYITSKCEEKEGK